MAKGEPPDPIRAEIVRRVAEVLGQDVAASVAEVLAQVPLPRSKGGRPRGSHYAGMDAALDFMADRKLDEPELSARALARAAKAAGHSIEPETLRKVFKREEPARMEAARVRRQPTAPLPTPPATSAAPLAVRVQPTPPHPNPGLTLALDAFTRLFPGGDPRKEWDVRMAALREAFLAEERRREVIRAALEDKNFVESIVRQATMAREQALQPYEAARRLAQTYLETTMLALGQLRGMLPPGKPPSED